MRGVPLHVYYIHFRQYIHPIGSDRPPWAAGEFSITHLFLFWIQFRRRQIVYIEGYFHV